MGKGGGGGRTPREAPDNLKSTQLLSVIDAISEGPIEGPVNGLQSILINNTAVVDSDGNANVKGVNVVYRVGEQPQSPLDGFEASGAETVLGVEVKHDNPITRTIVSENIDRLRCTFGVQSLVETTNKGDRNPSSVGLQIQIQREGAWVTEKIITITGKTTTQFLASVVIDNLPERPFGIRMMRTTPDSNSDQLQNKTIWSSYTEIIDIQQCYPNTAVIGVQVDAEQFGSQQVTRNYHLRGRIVQVPANYDPKTRTYTGIWNGNFKPAYTDNPAWCVLDLLTHPRYGLGQRIGIANVDKWSLYAIAQYCDQLVPDGFSGTEPRMTCNAYLTSQRKAYDVLSDFCSVMRCMPVWNGNTMTFVQDRPSDTVWPYTNSNVVNGEFKYGFSALKDRHNAVEVRYTDPKNGWKTSTELVEDHVAIERYGRNLLKMDAFGCTSRGQAHRMGLWVIKTEVLETQTVDFTLASEGLRHTPGDIFEVCDNNYADAQIGGRVLSVDGASRMLTLDRDVDLSSGGKATLSLIGLDGTPQSVDIQAQSAANKVIVKRLPEGINTYSVWGLKLPSLRRRLFRCVSVREGEDGTYSVTGVQHVPEKEAIVDNGASFDPQPGTGISVIPPEVQHLVVDVQPDNDQYQAKASWDTPRVVKGVRFIVRLTIGAGTASDPVRLVSAATITDTVYSFNSLALGRYTLTVCAVNGFGQQGDPTSVKFDISAPEAPVFIDITPGYFQITVTPRQSIYHADTQYEFWFSETKIERQDEVESRAKYLGTATYWNKGNLQKLGTDYFFYVRSINSVGKSAFVEAVGQVNSDASGVLDILKDQITADQMTQDFLKGIDNNLVKDEFEKALSDTEAKVDQKLEVLESSVGESTAQLQELKQTVAKEDKALSQRIDNVNVKVGENESAVQTISKAQADLKGDVSAMWSMQVQSTQDGKKAIAGIQATAEGGFGQVLILADRFAVMNPNNGSVDLPFVIQNGQIVMDEAFMKSLNINGRFIVTPSGELSVRANPNSNVGLRMSSALIQINDEQGRPAIKLGDTWVTL